LYNPPAGCGSIAFAGRKNNIILNLILNQIYKPYIKPDYYMPVLTG
jgi:hypothetical protein